MDLRIVVVFIALSVSCVVSRYHVRRNCMRPCTANYAPVCGSDGNTYSNQCELDVTKECVRRKSHLTKAHDGECRQDCPTICTMQYEPVCGTDGRTYGNECGLRSRSCRNGSSVQVAYQGECRK